MREKLRCMLVFGTRPEVIKLAPVALAMRAQPDRFDCLLVSTGQHRELSHQALEMFGLTPDIDLDLMSANQGVGEFFGRAVAGLDKVIETKRPDWVLVQGDTGTVLAGAIAAYYRKVRVAHIEAGLRSHDLLSPHPEEGNRQMVSRVTSLHLPPTDGARQALLREGIPDQRICVTGNTVVDAVKWVHQSLAPDIGAAFAPQAGERLILTTIHRRESFGEPLIGMLEAIRELSNDKTLGLTFLLPVHPNPHVTEAINRILGRQKNIKLVAPLDYKNMLSVMAKSWLVLTDSGGLQEEAPSFSVPVFVLRNCTERPEGVEAGVAKLLGTDKETIIRSISEIAQNADIYAAMRGKRNPYGDGNATRLILARLLKESEEIDA